jgi:hypothetical protein
MNEIEFYLLKVYKHNLGWRVSFFEIQNFNNGVNWTALSLERHIQNGFVLTWFSA